MKICRPAFLCVLLLCSFAAATTLARAQAVITWGTSTYISGDSDVSVNGTLVWAYNYGTTSVSPTINGITFTGATGSTSNVTFTTSGSSFFANATAFGSSSSFYTNLSSNYQNLLRSAVYWSGSVSDTQTVTFNSLTAGNTYQLQIWLNDSRNGFHYNMPITYSDGLGDTASLLWNNGSSPSLGQYVIGTFTATGSTETLILGPYSPQINAMMLQQVSAVPEPSTYAAIAGTCALLGVIARRRFRRARLG